ncbi:hypothetical protein DFQ28_004427 [Apophysomyces sp. BC1034]|nr:hypothetical protein DFQ30_001122 [Apophysomyces sp. BC1015]KAG0180727.1 hypothetical protein DFQ29_010232 [Apophysomyces sp. BC1021]KAG0188728.1 hypothetical protein DFQ28_004427 [Apophysomyces sp. BC1034]
MDITTLAPEIILHIFSFLPYIEVYRIGAVCRSWRQMGKEHIYMSIKTRRDRVTVKIGERNKVTIELFAYSYDPINDIIEFRPRPNDRTVAPVINPPMQIHFSEWAPEELPDMVKSMSLKEQALLLFHMNYNPAIERMYDLPKRCIGRPASSCDPHYVGDKGLILSLDYVYPNVPRDEIQNPSLHYGYPAATWMPASPCIQIRWLRVTLAWVVSGMNPEVPVRQIYADRYNLLDHALARNGLCKYDPLSEPVLAHIVDADDQEQCKSPCFPTLHSHSDGNRLHGEKLPHSLLKYVNEHTHECHTRLSTLQHMLEGAGVDARVIWKYLSAKSYVIGNSCLLGPEDVVRQIQDSEDEWRMKKPSLIRKLQA